ncbi:MAG: alpha/beta hydrolase [Burkholderiales bacterium]|nr:alpha/beta hydrolase [Burkholderiales bacterium]
MLRIDGRAVHCEVRGEGAPALFLHGNPDTSRLWSGVVGSLQSRFRCIAPDLPGFGRSEIDLDRFDFSLDGMAAWVEAVVTACGVPEPVNLAVHDFGGVYGLAWAVKHPQRVRSIAITNTLFQADYKWHFWARIWRTAGLGELSMTTFGVPVLGRALARLSIRAGSRKLSLAQIDRMFDEFTPSTRAMVLRLYRATDPQRFAGWEEAMLEVTARVPSLVLWGDHDPYIPKRYAERFGARTVVHLADCGHWVPSEEPAVASGELLQLFGAVSQ